MEESKISAAEIEVLRQNAEKERATRQRMQDYIWSLSERNLPASCQMELVRRGKTDEIVALLRAFTRCATSAEISPEAQIYLYEKGDKGENAEIYKMLLEKVPYTEKFAKRLIDDGKFCGQQKLSPKLEYYFLGYKHNYTKYSDAVHKNTFFTVLFRNIQAYYHKYNFSLEAELYLIKEYLNPEPFSDMYIDNCYKVVEQYIEYKKKLSAAGEKALIASGNHNLIMKYIQITKGKLKAEEELLARGNRKEVTAYFEYYASGSL